MPGRPRDLEFKAQGVARDEFPGLERLEQERERGRLLHFFANHELLATELMALVLLRFPDAPAAFRRGVRLAEADNVEVYNLLCAVLGITPAANDGTAKLTHAALRRCAPNWCQNRRRSPQTA